MAVSTYAQLKTEVATVAKRSDLTSEIPNFIARAENRMWRLLRLRAMETQGRMIWRADGDEGTVGGTGDAITLSGQTGTPSFGASYSFAAPGTNTGAATINGTAFRRIFEGVVEALPAGAVREGATYRAYYDGTQWLIAPQAGALLPGDFISLRSQYVDASSRQLQFIEAQTFWDRQAQNEVGRPRFATIEGDWLVIGPKPDSTYIVPIDYYRRLTALSGDSDTNAILTYSHEVYLYGALVELAQAKKMMDEALGWSIRFDDVVEDLNRQAKRGQHPAGPTMRSEVPVA